MLECFDSILQYTINSVLQTSYYNENLEMRWEFENQGCNKFYFSGLRQSCSYRSSSRSTPRISSYQHSGSKIWTQIQKAKTKYSRLPRRSRSPGMCRQMRYLRASIRKFQTHIPRRRQTRRATEGMAIRHGHSHLGTQSWRWIKIPSGYQGAVNWLLLEPVSVSTQRRNQWNSQMDQLT